jgi:hypothetical protein
MVIITTMILTTRLAIDDQVCRLGSYLISQLEYFLN